MILTRFDFSRAAGPMPVIWLLYQFWWAGARNTETENLIRRPISRLLVYFLASVACPMPARCSVPRRFLVWVDVLFQNLRTRRAYCSRLCNSHLRTLLSAIILFNAFSTETSSTRRSFARVVWPDLAGPHNSWGARRAPLRTCASGFAFLRGH